MIGNHAMADLSVRINACNIAHRANEGAHQIGGIIVMRALQHRRNPFKTHAGINGGFGETHALIGRNLFKLHEHQIPDLDETVAILIRGAGRATGDVVAMIVKNF